jgi:AFG3 family protein
MNQQDNNNRKYNQDNNNMPPKGEDPQKKKPRFNIYWVYGIIFLSVIGFNLFRNVSNAGIAMNQQYLGELLKAGDVEQDIKKDPNSTGLVVVRNKKIVRIFLNKDSVRNKPGFYKAFLKPADYENLS